MAGWITVRAGQVPPRHGRRSVLRLAVGATLALVAAGCTADADGSTAPDPSASSGPGGDREVSTAEAIADEADGADEEARAALLADVRRLSVLTAGAGAAITGPGAGVVASITQGLKEQLAALAPPAEGEGPPTSGQGPPAATPEQLVEALAAASGAAAGRAVSVSAPLARLAAALAAGHAVAATSLARTLGLGLPPGVTPPAVDTSGARTGETAPVPSAARSRVADRRTVADTLAVARDVEAQARYAYGVAAVHLREEALAVAMALRSAHDDTVGALGTALASAASASSSPPRDVYLIPFPVTDDTRAAMLGAGVEDACANAWADVVAAVAPGERAGATSLLVARAQQGAQWRFRLGQGAALVPLPGLSGRG